MKWYNLDKADVSEEQFSSPQFTYLLDGIFKCIVNFVKMGQFT